MKYFQHENTSANPKIKLLKRKYGAVGYGVYFQILEIILSDIEKRNFNEWGFLPEEYTNNFEFFSEELGIKSRHTTDNVEIVSDGNFLKEIVDYCCEIRLFEKKNGKLFCKAILDRCDEYTSKLKRQLEAISSKTPKNVGTKSGQTPKMSPKNNITKNNITKNIHGEVLNFWNATWGKRFKVLPEENFNFWLSKYSSTEIKQAIAKLNLSWMGKDAEPALIFRRRNPQREEVDYIGYLINIDEKKQAKNETENEYLRRMANQKT